MSDRDRQIEEAEARVQAATEAMNEALDEAAALVGVVSPDHPAHVLAKRAVDDAIRAHRQAVDALKDLLSHKGEQRH